MRIYIAGPMSGLPDNNYPAFQEAAKRLRVAGYEVLSPAELDVPKDSSWEGWMRASLAMMLKCDEVALLPEWHKSVGARLEQNLAAQLRMKCTTLEELLTKGK
jgi:Domain of unknown function (DUF4406)